MLSNHERSVPEVLHDIIGNLQDIFRSEFQLAKTEIKEEAVEARTPAATLGAGLVLAAYAVGLLLLSLMYGLAMRGNSRRGATDAATNHAAIARRRAAGTSRRANADRTPRLTSRSVVSSVRGCRRRSSR